MNTSADKIYTNEGNLDVLSLVGNESKIILDVGCGGGSLARILQHKGHIVDGITISEEERQTALPYLRNAFLFNLENGLPLELHIDSYDVVICSHVLEHILYPNKLLIQIKKVLKQGGAFIVALPNLLHYKSRMELLKGNFDYSEMGIWDNTHVKWYTFRSAKEILRHHGFNVVISTVTGHLPFYRLFKHLPISIEQKLYKLLITISKGLFGYQLLYKAIK